MTEGGVTLTIEVRLALFKSMVAKAIKGDTKAAALIIKRMDQLKLNDGDLELAVKYPFIAPSVFRRERSPREPA